MKQLSWADFDACVQVLTQRYGDRSFDGHSFDGVFGIPRGGLCLAVGLSHSLDLPLLLAPNNHCLIVDDVFETGQTLQGLRGQWPQATYAVWVSKAPPQWWDAAEVTASSEWILFPWENAAAVIADENNYRQSRLGS
ncbi:phosphoribosyltransferase [Synechococcus sp. AH-601-P18]|nr:phosphoribosyltransferase [Synechococcus sp. AH-601-P18]